MEIERPGRASSRTNRLPVPLSFILVVAASVAMVIFFGAWAVSADKGQLERTFSYGVSPGISPAVDPVAVTEGARVPSSNPGDLSAGQTGASADTWWGKGLLAACPIH